MKSDLVDIACKIRNDDPNRAAIAIADGTTEEVHGREREKWFWIPRSLVEVNDDGTITLPEWKAEELGLI